MFGIGSSTSEKTDLLLGYAQDRLTTDEQKLVKERTRDDLDMGALERARASAKNLRADPAQTTPASALPGEAVPGHQVIGANTSRIKA